MGVGRIRKKHIFFNPNIKRKKSGEKYKKAISWFILLLKKEKKEGLTKWIKKTKIKCLDRLKKYGISDKYIISELSKKGV